MPVLTIAHHHGYRDPSCTTRGIDPTLILILTRKQDPDYYTLEKTVAADDDWKS